MSTRAPVVRPSALTPYTPPCVEASARETPLERVSLCFLCSLWLDAEEQRRCELCGPAERRATP
jgi:hypothetical protein